MAGGPIYRIGRLVLLDLENPAIMLRRTDEWVLSPAEQYERMGDVPNVIFPTGLVHDPVSDRLRIYYGAADSAVASAPLTEVLDYLETPAARA